MGVPWAGDGLPGWCWVVGLDADGFVCGGGGVAGAELACLVAAPCPGVLVGVDTYSVYASCRYLGE